MSDFAQMIAIGTAACLLVVAYTYLVYPVAIYLLARAFGRPPVRPAAGTDDLPFLSLVIAAYNEEADIADRVRNALAADYPADRFEVVVASDGSTDRTNAIVAAFPDPRVVLLAFRARRGKAAVLNDVIPRAGGEVVMLSDANTCHSPDAPRKLAAWFQDPAVGVVCGRLVLTDPKAGRNVDSMYWKYETFLKKCESRLGALLGSNGGIYAIRRRLYVPIPPGTVVDDFVIPLLARAESGCRIVYDRDAVACEETPASMVSEFHRRARIGAGGFQSIGILRGLLAPRHGWVCFTFVSHKVLRWVCPFLLVAALVLNALLLDVPAFRGLFAAQLAFYALSLGAGAVPARPRALKVLRLPAMFTLMNAALFVGFWRWLFKLQGSAWRRTARTIAPIPVPVPAVDDTLTAEATVRQPVPAGVSADAVAFSSPAVQ